MISYVIYYADSNWKEYMEHPVYHISVLGKLKDLRYECFSNHRSLANINSWYKLSGSRWNRAEWKSMAYSLYECYMLQNLKVFIPPITSFSFLRERSRRICSEIRGIKIWGVGESDLSSLDGMIFPNTHPTHIPMGIFPFQIF